MWNQPNEFFIEAMSNASMDLFPENTLTKFSNKLARPIDISGDWVVGIQEIFYPTDISSTPRSISLHLLIGRSNKSATSEFTIEQNENIESIINKINAAIAKAFQTSKSKRVKRDTYSEFRSLLASSSDNLSTSEKISQLSDIKIRGLTVFNRMWDRINELSTMISGKDGQISKLTSNLTAKDVQLQKTKNELQTSKDNAADLERYKNIAKSQIEKQVEKINKLESEKTNPSEIVHLKESLASEKQRSLNFENSVVAKMSELAKLKEEYEKLKTESDAKITALNESHSKLQNIGTEKINELQAKLEAAKSPEAIENQKKELKLAKDQQENESKKIKKEIELEKKKLKDEQKILKNREIMYQQQLDLLNTQAAELKVTIKNLKEKLEKYVPLEEVDKMKQKIDELNIQKAKVESNHNTLQTKHDILKSDIEKLNLEMQQSVTEKEKLVNEFESIKRELHKFAIPDDFVVEIEEDDKLPSFEMVQGRLVIHRGYLNKQIVIPHFTDPAFIQTLGFDSYAHLFDLKRLMTTESSIKAGKEPTLDFKPHLMFVYSDIVSEHFVGDKCARVLRVLPLRHTEKQEIIHERFLKPFYYPLRSNRIDNINFMITDETGDPVKFNSGRVLIGLHLKKIV